MLPLAELAASVWLGPEWAVSRYQDWRANGTRIECVDRSLPARTAHFLPLRLDPEAAPVGSRVELRVRMELLPADDGSPWSLDAAQWAGVLVGVGNRNIDHRLSAIVQQAPGVEGGTLVACGGDGRPRVVDFTHAPDPPRFAWSLPAKLDWARLRRLDQGAAEIGAEDAPRWSTAAPLELRVVITRAIEGCDLTVHTVSGGLEIGAATARALSNDRIDGGIALCCTLAGARAGVSYTVERMEASSPAWCDTEGTRGNGPVLGVLYTVDRPDQADASERTLRVNAQFPPVDPASVTELALWIGEPNADAATGRESGTASGATSGGDAGAGRHADDGLRWTRVGAATIDAASCTAQFTATLPARNGKLAAIRYAVRGVWTNPGGVAADFDYRGAIRAEPARGQDAVIAALSCVKNLTRSGRWDHEGVWFPHADLSARVLAHDPDLLYFAGDQLYEGDISGADMRAARLDYLTKWHRFLWAFSALTRDRPTICAPDDHDVFHGNLWGAAGRRAIARDGLTAQDAGGYKLPADVVAAVHRSQTGHHPPTRITPVVGDGITTWTTRLVWGPFDCAIVSDRMFKESASVAAPGAKVRNGFITAVGHGAAELVAASADAPLLGEAQEAFLGQWADDPRDDAPVRLLLSQSPFAGLQTLPAGSDDGILPSLPVLGPGEFYPDDAPAVDTDSHGWPVAARDRAVALLRRAGAVHIAGDQHLSSVVRYGHADEDPVAFTVPAMANAFPRHWTPSHGVAPDERRLTGRFRDGFGNAVTMLAVANPARTDRRPEALAELSPGFGIIRFRPAPHTLVLEAWPRVPPPAQSPENDRPFAGWPVEVGVPGAHAP